MQTIKIYSRLMTITASPLEASKGGGSQPLPLLLIVDLKKKKFQYPYKEGTSVGPTVAPPRGTWLFLLGGWL